METRCKRVAATRHARHPQRRQHGPVQGTGDWRRHGPQV